jgi:tetratricopeptide (TPR) repeat protein
MKRAIFVFLLLLNGIGMGYASQPQAPAPVTDRYLTYLQGLIEEQAGHLAQALAHYEEVVKQDPHALEVYRDIAQLSLQLNRPETAEDAAEHIKQLAPKDPESFIFVGNVEMAQGNLAKAADAYEQALTLDPKNLRALENLGNYYAIVDPHKALSYYERYLTIDSGDGEIYFQIGVVHQKLGDLKMAETNYHQAVQLDPQQLPPHLALAELYELQKSTPAAVGEYTEALKLQPHNALLYMRLGRLHYQLRDWDASYSDFQNAKTLEPTDATANYWLARVSEERQQWAEAAKYAEDAYKLTKDAQFMPLAAYYLTLDHRLPQAVKWLEKARRLNPDGANVLLFLGMDYLDLNKPAKARAVLSHGLAAHPEDAQIRFQLGVAYDRLGNFAEAERQFNGVLAVDPQNAGAMNYLGYSWTERGVKLDEAEKMLRQAVEIDADNGAYLDSLGWLRLKRGDAKEAVGLLEHAAKVEPDPLIYDHLGDAYRAAAEYDKAAESWTKSLALDSKNADVKNKLHEVSSHVLPTTRQRKYLKYIEGNMRQIFSLRSHAVVEARWKKHPLQAEGQFIYYKPDQAVFTLNAPTTPPPQVSVRGNDVRVQPDSFSEKAKALPLSSLTVLPQFFSGALTAPIDDAAVEVSSGAQGIHYVSAKRQQAWVDPQRHVLTRFEQANPKGGEDVIEFEAYALVEGLWLPGRVRLKNDSQKWAAQFSFTEWEINVSTADAPP